MTATRARFTGRVEPINLDHGSPVPGRFVLQLPHKLAPAHVGNRLCEGWVLHHILDRQALDHDRLVFTNQVRRKLMLGVFASSSYARVDDGHTPSLFCAVRASPSVCGRAAVVHGPASSHRVLHSWGSQRFGRQRSPPWSPDPDRCRSAYPSSEAPASLPRPVSRQKSDLCDHD
jgi:hypothetical protein